jgi:hypothetical protein
MIPRHYLDDSASKGLASDEHFAQPVENMVDQVASRFRSTKDMDYVKERLSKVPMTASIIDSLNGHTGQGGGATPLQLFLQQQQGFARQATASINNKRR